MGQGGDRLRWVDEAAMEGMGIMNCGSGRRGKAGRMEKMKEKKIYEVYGDYDSHDASSLQAEPDTGKLWITHWSECLYQSGT